MPHRQPHVSIYLRLLEKAQVPYDIICWNRKGDKLDSIEDNYVVYNHPTNDDFPAWKKLFECRRFASFVKSNVDKDKYFGVIVFTIATALFSYRFITQKFKDKYVFDIRDWSPLMNVSVIKTIVSKLIRDSYCTCISSEGFKHWLPKDYLYVVSHNIDQNKLQLYVNASLLPFDNIHLLTIGNLRDGVSNSEVISAFGNDRKFVMDFVGDGDAAPFLKSYCIQHNINNVFFHGYYRKDEEDSFIKKCDLMNVYLPNNMLSNYLMTNRFYLSVVFRKPMIVNEGCFQAEMVSKYHLGLVVQRDKNMKEQLVNYINSFDSKKYEMGCVDFLKMVCEQVNYFNEKILDFITAK
jgi:hypothetical protein